MAAVLCGLIGLLSPSCQDDTAGLGDRPVVTDDMFRVYIDPDDENLVHFDFVAERLSAYWEIENGGITSTYSEREFTLTMSRGDYTGYITAYGRGGRSDRHQFTFHVDALDPSYKLLCGKDNDKVWVFDRYGQAIDATTQRIFGYLWGEPWESNSWFNPTGDLEVYGVMDDEISFRNDGGFFLNPGSDSKVWVDGGGWGDVERAGQATWSATGNESWSFVENGGKRYIQFGGGAFPAIIADPAAIDQAYEIVELGENRLCLRWWRGEGDGIEYNFCPKDYQGEIPTPPTPPDPPTPPVQQDITPLPSGAPEYALLTAHAWVAGDKYGYYYGAEDLYDTPDQARDEVLTFNADGTMRLDSDGDVYADDGNGHFSYTPSGTEGYVLGTNADGKLCIQFTGGGFPIMRANEAALDQVYEVYELSASTLKLFWGYGDGGGLLIILKAKDGGSEPEQPENPEQPEEPVNPSDPTADALTAHQWALRGVEFGDSGFYDIAQCADEVLTFNADGTLLMTGDGTAFDNDEGPRAYTMTGAERWALGEADGARTITFSGGAYPIVLANADALNSAYRIAELDADKCTLVVPYWGLDFYIYLIKK